MMDQRPDACPDFKFTLPANVLDDLCCRFIINVPAQEKKDLVRICFQIEQAHWFYLDFYSNKLTYNLKSCGIKEFAKNIFYHIPYLRPFIPVLDSIIEEWKEYKYSVPTFGAIVLDEELKNVLLVKSYWSKSSWGFPKGKINKDETPCHCAAREVFEETGFNITPLIDPNAYLEATINEQRVRLYIIPGVSRHTEFHPMTRNEIKEINWFPIEEIPIGKVKAKNKSSHSFFMVIPFMRDLRKWILQNFTLKTKPRNRRSFKSFSEVEHLLQNDACELATLSIKEGSSKDVDMNGDVTVMKKKRRSKNHKNQEQKESEHYEGSDEEETVISNEEIYGIPKLKYNNCSNLFQYFPNLFYNHSTAIKKGSNMENLSLSPFNEVSSREVSLLFNRTYFNNERNLITSNSQNEMVPINPSILFSKSLIEFRVSPTSNFSEYIKEINNCEGRIVLPSTVSLPLNQSSSQILRHNGIEEINSKNGLVKPSKKKNVKDSSKNHSKSQTTSNKISQNKKERNIKSITNTKTFYNENSMKEKLISEFNRNPILRSWRSFKFNKNVLYKNIE